MATPYENIAKAALINWNGLSEEEAQRKIESESFQELESQVFAAGSIKYAVIGISKQVGLTESETYDFFLAVINGPENAKIFDIVREKAKGFTEEQELNVLSDIHDGWVQDNSSEKTFNKKVDRQQLRQYAPLELIGWNEAKSDLLFLNPVLESIGVKVDEEALEQAYHDRVVDYLDDNVIISEDDLTDLIMQGREYYPALPEELEKRLLPMSEVVSEQIMKNWDEKNPAIAARFIPKYDYEEMEVEFGDNLESVVYRLLAENAKGNKVFCDFNDHRLYSDKVTMDSAFKEVTGRTKEEYDEFLDDSIKKFEEKEKEQKNREQEYKNMVQESTNGNEQLITEEKVVTGLKYIAEHQNLEQKELLQGLLDLGCNFSFNDINKQFPEDGDMPLFEGMKNGNLSCGASVIINMRDSEFGRAFGYDRFLSVDDSTSIYHFIRLKTGDDTYTKEKVDQLNKNNEKII